MRRDIDINIDIDGRETDDRQRQPSDSDATRRARRVYACPQVLKAVRLLGRTPAARRREQLAQRPHPAAVDNGEGGRARLQRQRCKIRH